MNAYISVHEAQRPEGASATIVASVFPADIDETQHLLSLEDFLVPIKRQRKHRLKVHTASVGATTASVDPPIALPLAILSI